MATGWWRDMQKPQDAAIGISTVSGHSCCRATANIPSVAAQLGDLRCSHGMQRWQAWLVDLLRAAAAGQGERAAR